jgi:hypothetical protein
MRGVEKEMLFYIILVILALALAFIFAMRYLKIDLTRLLPV